MELVKINGHEVAPGDTAFLAGYGGKVYRRRVVEALPAFRRIHACREEEYLAAQAEGRPPKTVGWPGAAIMAVTKPPKNEAKG